MTEWIWTEQTKVYVHGDETEPVTCRLRWTHTKPGNYKGIWQVTTMPPPISLVNWKDPPGLIASGRVDLQPNGAEFQVTFLPRIAMVSGMSSEDEFFPAPANFVFYLRVIGLDSRGDPDEMPSNWVSLAYSRIKVAPAAPPHGRAMIDAVTFQPFKLKHPKAHEWFLVTQDKHFFPIKLSKGQTIRIIPEEKDKEWYEHVIAAFEDLGKFIQEAVNWVSDAWKDIKAWAVNTLADAIPGCDDTCKEVLAKGLDYGLGAMGIPPSIPNFDEFAKMGKGYLVVSLAAEAGVPPELVEKGVGKLLQKAEQVANTGPSGDEWLRPHPDYMYKPPFVHVTVKNPDELPSLAGFMTVEHQLFTKTDVNIPPLEPSQSLTIPVNVDPKDVWGRAQAVKKKTKMIPSYSECGKEWWSAYVEQVTLLRVKTADDWFMQAFVAAQGYTTA